jgi:hypothetical protein
MRFDAIALPTFLSFQEVHYYIAEGLLVLLAVHAVCKLTRFLWLDLFETQQNPKGRAAARRQKRGHSSIG